MRQLLIVLFILVISLTIYAQVDYDCGMENPEILSRIHSYSLTSVTSQRGGLNAPAKTLNNSSFRIIVIFAQLASDTKDDTSTIWPLNQMPVWATKFVGQNASEAPFYPNSLSNYFWEMSSGQNIILGYVYPKLVKIYMPPSSDFADLNDSVITKVDNDIDFSKYDLWDTRTNYNQKYNSPDGYVDGVYIIYRNITSSWGGIAMLGKNFVTKEGKTISNRIPTISMTVNAGHKSDYRLETKIGLLAHEYGHYLFGSGHNFEPFYGASATRQRGYGLMPGNSGTVAMNPQEKYMLGYANYTDLVVDQTGILPDYQSTGTAFRIPIPLFKNGKPNVENPAEWFVVANHQKLTPYEFVRGVGITIYHVKDTNYTPNCMDIVSANGTWQWSVKKWNRTPSGLGGPADWQQINTGAPDSLPVFVHNSPDRINGRDQMQEIMSVRYGDGRYYWWDRWFDDDGAYAPLADGTQTDAFTPGYNEVFNSYSNPATYGITKTNNNFAFRIISQAGTNYTIQFLRDSLAVLSDLPPSKPQIIYVLENAGCAELHWAPNLEPDMKPNGQYSIYRSETNSAPSSFYLVTSINAYSGDTPVTSWIDEESGRSYSRKLYYKIKAIDNSRQASVFSGYVWKWGRIPKCSDGNEDDGALAERTFINCLLGNYPNPFNPFTKIAYSLKERGSMSLIVYNILGKEVARLGEGIQEAGEHTVNFNGVNFPSGLYIYELRSNEFISRKKMMLIK